MKRADRLPRVALKYADRPASWPLRKEEGHFDCHDKSQSNLLIRRFAHTDLRKCDTAAIGRAGSRSDVCARQPGQVRKEAATTGCGGSAGSFSALRIRLIPACKSRSFALPVLTAQMAAARRFSNLDIFGAI